MTTARLNLQEWETASPTRGSVLEGRNLSADLAGRQLAGVLSSQHQLEILELLQGLEVRATSFVGRITFGDVEVTVHPKISGAPLLNLFRYAYNLRNLHLYNSAYYNTTQWSFQDLLIQQLCAEAEELLARGLHRDYLSTSEDLASPRGRIDFNRFVRVHQPASATLPCVHFPRSENNLLNRVLLSGILLAARLTTDFELRARLRRLAKVLAGEMLKEIVLDFAILDDAWRSVDRRPRAYEPALKLIELLLGQEGASLDGQNSVLRLRGFLFDMNRFFQALMSRFLREYLPEYEVEDERRLMGMFAYDPNQNPQNRKPPTPRPDFAILRDHRLVAVLDAKYRDLWEKPLPHHMLYQLALYALGHAGTERRAAILYPTLNQRAIEQSIVVQEAVRGASRAHVILRPVNLLHMDGLLQAGTSLGARNRRIGFAHLLAFGTTISVRAPQTA